MKKIFTVGLILAVLLVFSCGSSGGGKSAAGNLVAHLIEPEWTIQTDAADGGDSKMELVVAEEVIDGKTVKTYTISGELTPTYKNSYLNLIMDTSDEAQMEIFKAAKSFSVSVLGEKDKRLTFYFMTSDVKDWAFHAYNIDTTGSPQTVTFKTGMLFQPSWGTELPLRAKNCNGIRFAPSDANRGQGPFKFKFWNFQVLSEI